MVEEIRRDASLAFRKVLRNTKAVEAALQIAQQEKSKATADRMLSELAVKERHRAADAKCDKALAAIAGDLKDGAHQLHDLLYKLGHDFDCMNHDFVTASKMITTMRGQMPTSLQLELAGKFQSRPAYLSMLGDLGASFGMNTLASKCKMLAAPFIAPDEESDMIDEACACLAPNAAVAASMGITDVVHGRYKAQVFQHLIRRAQQFGISAHSELEERIKALRATCDNATAKELDNILYAFGDQLAIDDAASVATVEAKLRRILNQSKSKF